MAGQSLNIISIVLFIVAGFRAQTTVGIETCSETIRKVCDCLFHPVFTIRCSHKSLYDYPDLKTIQVRLCSRLNCFSY